MRTTPAKFDAIHYTRTVLLDMLFLSRFIFLFKNQHGFPRLNYLIIPMPQSIKVQAFILSWQVPRTESRSVYNFFFCLSTATISVLLIESNMGERGLPERSIT